MDKYTHSYREAETEAIGVLPDLSRASRQAIRATGTGDAVGGEKKLGVSLGAFPATSMPSVDSGRRSSGTVLESVTGGEDTISAEKLLLGSVCTSGEGPGLQNQWGA